MMLSMYLHMLSVVCRILVLNAGIVLSLCLHKSSLEPSECVHIVVALLTEYINGYIVLMYNNIYKSRKIERPNMKKEL